MPVLADQDRRTALGTGWSPGLGAAMCRTLARAGAQVAVHPARDAVRAVAVEPEIVAGGGRAVPVGGDFHDADAVRAMVVRAQDVLGLIDIAVNNVGRKETTGGTRLNTGGTRSGRSLTYKCSQTCPTQR